MKRGEDAMGLFENKDERIKDFGEKYRIWHDNDDLVRNQNLMAYLNDGGFFTAPASSKYHGAYEGGLYDHSRTVMEELERITYCMGLKWQRPESPFIIGMFHDLCKCDQYKLVTPTNPAEPIPSGVKFIGGIYEPLSYYDYNKELLLTGHGEKSVMILSQFMQLTEEEMLCIRYHMGAYMTDEWAQYDLAIRKYPNLLYVHTADQLASKVVGT